MFSFQSEYFLDSLLTWHTQLNKESGATIVIHMFVCLLSKAIKSIRVAHVPSSEALLHDKRNPATPTQMQAAPQSDC